MLQQLLSKRVQDSKEVATTIQEIRTKLSAKRNKQATNITPLAEQQRIIIETRVEAIEQRTYSPDELKNLQIIPYNAKQANPATFVASEVDKYQATITAQVLDMYNPFRIGREAYQATNSAVKIGTGFACALFKKMACGRMGSLLALSKESISEKPSRCVEKAMNGFQAEWDKILEEIDQQGLLENKRRLQAIGF